VLPIVEIRKAKLKDVPAITALWQVLIDCHIERCGYGEPIFRYIPGNLPVQIKYFESAVRSRNSLLLIAEDEGKAVGYVIARIQKLPPILIHDKEVHIGGIFSKEGYRRKGIGRKFFSEVEAWAKRKGVFSVGLMVSVHNDDAKDSYERLGYKGHHLKMSKEV
jgi:ribosomal protein S18 acetylase RimI-like enzyme